MKRESLTRQFKYCPLSLPEVVVTVRLSLSKNSSDAKGVSHAHRGTPKVVKFPVLVFVLCQRDITRPLFAPALKKKYKKSQTNMEYMTNTLSIFMFEFKPVLVPAVLN